MKSFITKIVILYFSLLTLFTILIIGVHLIPKSFLVDNVIVSSKILQKEGMFPQYKDYRLTRLDNYTDALMMNISVSADDNHPIDASMKNIYYDYIEDEDIDKAYHTEKVAKGDTTELTSLSYGRYWQGYQVSLRPVLCFFNLYSIRIFNYIAMSLLLIWCLYLIKKKIGIFEAITLIAILFCFNIAIVPYSLQFSTCFYWMFISCIALMEYPLLTKNKTYLILTFFTIGAVTVYFDFLTTPQLTLGLPLILTILIRKPEKSFYWVILACLAWILGYGILWASKWLIGFLLTNNNLLEDAMTQAKLRTSHLYHQRPMTIPRMIRYLIPNLEHISLLKVTYVISILGVIYLFFQKGIKVQIKYAWLILIIMIVPVWFLIMRQHSIEHRYFTMRAFIVTFYALILWIYYTTKKQK